jgi:DNA-directed RNA polymerase specialized sigma54-like protein
MSINSNDHRRARKADPEDAVRVTQANDNGSKPKESDWEEMGRELDTNTADFHARRKHIQGFDPTGVLKSNRNKKLGIR